MDVRSNVPFDIPVASLTNATLHVPQHIVVFSYKDSMFNMIDLEQVDKERRHTIATVQPTSKPPVQENECANASKYRRDTSNIPPEYAAYCTSLIIML